MLLGKSYLSPHKCWVWLLMETQIWLFAAYSQTKGDRNVSAKEFHEEVCRTADTTPTDNILIVLGDPNAHPSKEKNSEDPCLYFHNNTNQNGKLLRDTQQEANLMATNPGFVKNTGKMWIYISDAHLSKSQIDCILVRKKWRKCVLNTESHNYFSTLCSDHQLVMNKVWMSSSPDSNLRLEHFQRR